MLGNSCVVLGQRFLVSFAIKRVNTRLDFFSKLKPHLSIRIILPLVPSNFLCYPTLVSRARSERLDKARRYRICIVGLESIFVSERETINAAASILKIFRTNPPTSPTLTHICLISEPSPSEILIHCSCRYVGKIGIPVSLGTVAGCYAGLSFSARNKVEASCMHTKTGVRT